MNCPTRALSHLANHMPASLIGSTSRPTPDIWGMRSVSQRHGHVEYTSLDSTASTTSSIDRRASDAACSSLIFLLFPLLGLHGSSFGQRIAELRELVIQKVRNTESPEIDKVGSMRETS